LDISFKNAKTRKSFNEAAQLEREHGLVRAEKIRRRLAELRAASCLQDLGTAPPARCHELTKGQRKGQLSVDLDHPYRLILVPDHEPAPVKTDGGLDWTQVTAIKILGVEDTHE
jgi:proteic killer suppression protein